MGFNIYRIDTGQKNKTTGWKVDKCNYTVLKFLRVPWTARRFNQSILNEINPGISLRNDAKAEAPVLWPPHAKSWLIGEDSDVGRDWGQEEKGTTEDEMGGWHHWLDGRESEWTPGDGDGQGGLVCCDSWGRKESDTTERLNWTELNPLPCSIACWSALLWCLFSIQYLSGIIQGRIDI